MLIEVDGIKILLLACDIYNFSPDYESDLDVCELKDKKILHFKGPRKKYMELYWQYYLSEQDSSDWQKKYNLLLKRFEASQADRLDMKVQIQQLNQDNSYLRNNLKAKIKSLRKQNDHLQNKNKELTDKLDLLKEKSEQL